MKIANKLDTHQHSLLNRHFKWINFREELFLRVQRITFRGYQFSRIGHFQIVRKDLILRIKCI